MNLYIRIFGGAFIMIAALLVGKEYSRFSDKRIAELRGFLLFIRHIGAEVSKFLSSGEELFWRFENEALEASGFLPSLREGMGLKESFEFISKKLSIPSEQKEDLFEFFSGFGSDYREGELEKINAFLAKYEKDVEIECENMMKNLMVARALLLGGAIWAGIMVV